MDKSINSNLKKAAFGAGCFWSVEDKFRGVEGVVDVVSGYMGGDKENPTYEEVCAGTTGHAETVEVTYDPQQTTYNKLLDVFWGLHDPTQKGGQGPDVGSQYRSIIFYYGDEQKKLAEESKRKLDTSGKYDKPIVTEVVSAGTFTRAEEYHQRYLEKRGLSTCRV